jgi:hypothetical protein
MWRTKRKDVQRPSLVEVRQLWHALEQEMDWCFEHQRLTGGPRAAGRGFSERIAAMETPGFALYCALPADFRAQSVPALTTLAPDDDHSYQVDDLEKRRTWKYPQYPQHQFAWLALAVMRWRRSEKPDRLADQRVGKDGRYGGLVCHELFSGFSPEFRGRVLEGVEQKIRQTYPWDLKQWRAENDGRIEQLLSGVPWHHLEEVLSWYTVLQTHLEDAEFGRTVTLDEMLEKWDIDSLDPRYREGHSGIESMWRQAREVFPWALKHIAEFDAKLSADRLAQSLHWID